MVSFLGGALLVAASNFIMFLRPVKEVLPELLFFILLSFFLIYLIMIFAVYETFKEYLDGYDFYRGSSVGPSFSEYMYFTPEEIKERKIKSQVSYITQKETFLSPSYVAKKILTKKINIFLKKYL